LREDGRVFACGNGGSMSDAMHFTEELCGRFRETRPALGALAFSDPATLTCIANDFGFEEVFARQIEAQGRPGDVLVLLSTSGNSPNVVRAAQAARATGVETIGLLGRGGGNAATEIDVPIVVPWAKTAERIQEAHLLILHTFVESIEGALFPGSAGRR
ncbi:MAG: SIS domain-containing protein, partial [Myxococcota bacterium]